VAAASESFSASVLGRLCSRAFSSLILLRTFSGSAAGRFDSAIRSFLTYVIPDRLGKFDRFRAFFGFLAAVLT
jgi:hypothetical protein